MFDGDSHIDKVVLNDEIDDVEKNVRGDETVNIEKVKITEKCNTNQFR